MTSSRRPVMAEAAAWLLLTIVILGASRGLLFNFSVPVTACVAVTCTALGLGASTWQRQSGAWAFGSLVAAPVMGVPLATAVDSVAFRVILMALPPLAIAGAAWWLAALASAPRWPVGLVGFAAALMVAVDIRFRDPFRELRCRPICPVNPWVVEHRTHVIQTMQWVVLIAVLIAILFAARSVFGRVDRRGWVPALGAAAAMAIGAVDLVRREQRTPDSRVAALAISGQLVAVAVAVLATLAPLGRGLMGRRRVRRWATTIEATGGHEVIGELRVTANDPTLRVVDSAVTSPGRATTTLRLGGRAVAVVEHRHDSAERLRAAISPPLIAVLENELLLSQARRQLHDLQQARHTVVSRGDDARRRLQRDLHDGAQQRLIALGMEMSALAAASTGGRGSALETAARHATEALTSLRRIAHGPVPPLLDDAGLFEALATLPEDSKIAYELDIAGLGGRCFAPDIEHAAYRFVTASAAEALASGAGVLHVRAELTDGLQVTTTHRATELSNREADDDRVAATGGETTHALVGETALHCARFP